MTTSICVGRISYRLLGPVLSFQVLGDPIGQGRVSFMGKGRPAVHSNRKLLLPWRDLMAATAHNAKVGAIQPDQFPLLGPVGLHLYFTVAKPASAPKRRRIFPIKRPDLSHFTRAAEDALTAAGVFKDDSQVIYELATKAYPGEETQALDVPGVVIYVYKIGEADA